MRVYIAPKVLIIGEMGYLTLDDLGATIFFQLVSARCEGPIAAPQSGLGSSFNAARIPSGMPTKIFRFRASSVPASAQYYINAGEIPLVGNGPYLIRLAVR
jgi:hypothetical protein